MYHTCICVFTLPTLYIYTRAGAEQNDRTNKQVYLSTVSIVITASYCGEYNILYRTCTDDIS